MASTEKRFEVFNVELYSDYPNAVPAGRYDRLLDAIKHAESVTYKMGVVDTQAESRGFVYCNWISCFCCGKTIPYSNPPYCRTCDGGTGPEACLKIVLYAHLEQADFPWSTGRVKPIRTMEATDAAMHYAEAFVAESQSRRETSRLRVFWELKGGS